MTDHPDPALADAADLIAQADALVITAGAGMGVDSGLPDFRGSGGFWKAYPALAAHGLSFAQIASPAAFARDPRLAWGFYGHRLALYRATRPHAGFGILKGWTDTRLHGAWVFTSNVDGHFQRAGFDDVHECHGSIHHLQCSVPCSDAVWPADGFDPVVDVAQCRLTSDLPTCPSCGAVARPNILMFNDGGWLDRPSRAQATRLEAWLDGARRIVSVEIGAGTAIPSVRHFNHRLVREHGAWLVRINPDDSAVSPSIGVGVAGRALVTLEQIAAILTP